MVCYRWHIKDERGSAEPSLATCQCGGAKGHGRIWRLALTEPTVSFTWEDRLRREIATVLGKQGIFVWDGNYSVLAVAERLGLEGSGGMVRIGAVHYNTVEEIHHLGDALRTMS